MVIGLLLPLRSCWFDTLKRIRVRDSLSGAWWWGFCIKSEEGLWKDSSNDSAKFVGVLTFLFHLTSLIVTYIWANAVNPRKRISRNLKFHLLNWSRNILFRSFKKDFLHLSILPHNLLLHISSTIRASSNSLLPRYSQFHKSTISKFQCNSNIVPSLDIISPLQHSRSIGKRNRSPSQGISKGSKFKFQFRRPKRSRVAREDVPPGPGPAAARGYVLFWYK